MSHRLQALVPAWVRRAIRAALERRSRRLQRADALLRLSSLNAPTADIEDMLAEIESGRS